MAVTVRRDRRDVREARQIWRRAQSVARRTGAFERQIPRWRDGEGGHHRQIVVRGFTERIGLVCLIPEGGHSVGV